MAGTRHSSIESSTDVLQLSIVLVMAAALHSLLTSTDETLTVLRRNIAIYKPLAWKQTVVKRAFSDVVNMYRTSILKGVESRTPARRVVLNSILDKR